MNPGKLTKEQIETRMYAAEATLEECRNALEAVLQLERSGKTRKSMDWAEVMLSVGIALKCCEMHEKNYSSAGVLTK